MSGHPDIKPDVWRVKDFMRPGRSQTTAINDTIQATRRDDGSCGGIVEFQDEKNHIDEPLVLNVHDVTFRGPGGPSILAKRPQLVAEYDGPIFMVPHDSPCEIGGLKFESQQFDCNGGELRSGVEINTGGVYRSWFDFDWCYFKRCDPAIRVHNSGEKSWGAIGNLSISRCNVTWSEQGLVGTNGARCHMLSVRDSAFRQLNREAQHPFANHLNGECHVWENVNLEDSGNAIFYDRNSMALEFRNLWLEKMTGDFALRLEQCRDVHIGWQRRYKCAMASPIQLHQCGRGQCWPDALVTEPKT